MSTDYSTVSILLDEFKLRNPNNCDQAEDFLSEYRDAKELRRPYNATYDQISNYVSLRTPLFSNEDNKVNLYDIDRIVKLYDTSGLKFRNELAGRFFSTLFSPTKQWFNLQSLTGTAELTNASEKAEKKYYQQCESICLERLVLANFYPKIHSMFLEYTSHGMGILYGEVDKVKNNIKFKTISFSSCYFLTNDEDSIDTCFRVINLKPRQAYQLFKDNEYVDASIKGILKEMMIDEKYRDMDQSFVHVVRPNLYDNNYTALPFESAYIWIDQGFVISKSGYKDFPYFIARWDSLPEQIYSTGPGELCLADSRSLNQLLEYTFQNVKQKVRPAYQAPTDTFISPISLLPDAINLYEADRGYAQNLISPIQHGGDIETGVEFSRYLQMQIADKFSKDALEEQKKSDMTATEFSGRELDRLQELIPQYVRILSEFGYRLVSFIYNSYDDLGLLPKKPDTIKSSNVVFISELAKAQERAGLSNLSNTIQDLLSLYQIKPEIADYINGDNYARLVSLKHDAPIDVFNDEEAVQQVRQQRQQEQAQNQDLARVTELAKAKGPRPQ